MKRLKCEFNVKIKSYMSINFEIIVLCHKMDNFPATSVSFTSNMHKIFEKDYQSKSTLLTSNHIHLKNSEKAGGLSVLMINIFIFKILLYL